MNGHVIASVRLTRRGRRPWHAWTLLAREPGGLVIGQYGLPFWSRLLMIVHHRLRFLTFPMRRAILPIMEFQPITGRSGRFAKMSNASGFERYGGEVRNMH